MRTYYFTIAAAKSTYFKFAESLKKSAELLEIPLHILGSPDMTVEQAKHLKIDGVLNVPSGYDRIAYLDADCLMVDVSGMENINGALLEDWGHSLRHYVAAPYCIKAQKELLDRENMSEMWIDDDNKSNWSEYTPLEWNSGVIVGDVGFMKELATEWEKWWHLVNKANGNVFIRDQISFKYAYYNVGVKKYGFRTIPKSYNWLIKRWAFPPNVNILHKAGRPNGKMCYFWDCIKDDVFNRDYVGIVPNIELAKVFPKSKYRFGDVTKFLFDDGKIEGVELGVLCGEHAYKILSINPNCKLHCVDLWDLNPEKNKDYVNNTYVRDNNARKMRDVGFGQSCYDRAVEMVKPFGDRANILKMSSEEAVLGFGDGSLDFVYIDADHSYVGVRRDLELWYPKIKRGGYIAGHDYGSSRLKGVTQAVREFQRLHNLPLIHNGHKYADWIIEVR